MSRSSTNVLAIGLGACDVALGAPRPVLSRLIERLRGPHAPRAASPTSAHDAHEAAPDEGGPAPLLIAMDEALRYTEQGAFDALRRAFAAHAGAVSGRANAKRRAQLVLDDFWGNHAILRGDFRAMRARDIEQIAQAYFADTFGLDAATLALRWQLQRGGQALFASALPRSLCDGIQEVSAAARVDVRSVTLGLPQLLNRVRHTVAGRDALLLVVAESLLHAVTIDARGWAAYDTQRLFVDDAADPWRLAEIARHVFERSPARRRDDCDVYLCGLAVDPAPFEQRFAKARQLCAHVTRDASALRLMEFAR